MALEKTASETPIEAGEEKQMAAVAGGVLVVGRLGVEFLKNCAGVVGHSARMTTSAFSCRARRRQSRAIAPIQIPEQEPRHTPSVTEA